jgi:hypothetical protein
MDADSLSGYLKLLVLQQQLYQTVRVIVRRASPIQQSSL